MTLWFFLQHSLFLQLSPSLWFLDLLPGLDVEECGSSNGAAHVLCPPFSQVELRESDSQPRTPNRPPTPTETEWKEREVCRIPGWVHMEGLLNPLCPSLPP